MSIFDSYENPVFIRSQNMLINRQGEGILAYHVPGVNTSFLDEDSLKALRNHIADFHNEFAMDWEWRGVVRPYRPDENLNDIRMERVPEGLREARKQAVQLQAEDIRRNVPMKSKHYLLVHVKPKSHKAWSKIKEILSDIFWMIPHQTGEMMGDEPYRVPVEIWEVLQQMEEEVFQNIRNNYHVKVERVPESELLYLTEQSYCKGHIPDVQEQDSQLIVHDNFIYVSKADMERGTHDVDLNFKRPVGQVRWIKESAEDLKPKRGYSCYLTVSSLPLGIDFPGPGEIFRLLRELEFPTDYTIKTERMENEEAVEKLSGIRQIMAGQIQHILESKDDAYDDEDGEDTTMSDRVKRAINLSLEKRLKQTKEPIFKTQIILSVWGKNPKEVRERRRELARKLKDAGIRVDYPLLEQKLLFYQTLPGHTKVDSHYFVRPLAEFLASFMPLGTTEVGDPTGIYIGNTMMDSMEATTGSVGRSAVFYNPAWGRNELSLSTSSVFLGSLGRGKSMLVSYLMYHRVLNGEKILAIEPKDEKWAWPYELPELAPYVNIVTVGTDEKDRGKFDPLVNAPDDDPAERNYLGNFAEEVLHFLTGVNPDSWEGQAISEAVDVTLNEEQPSMLRVLDNLERFLKGEIDLGDVNREKARDNVERILSFLRRQAYRTTAHLIFGDGTQEAIDTSNRLTILQIQNLTVPDPDKPNYRTNMVNYICITEFARRFVNMTSGSRSVVYEEAYRITAEKEGQNSLRELIRTCRSKDADLMMVVHNARDLRIDTDTIKRTEGEDGGEEIRSNLGNRFIFSVGDRTEAKAACDLLGIEPSDKNITMIQNLDKGEWIMRDVEHRVAKVKMQLDQLNPRLFKAFDTRPEANERREREFGHLRRRRKKEVTHDEKVDAAAADSERDDRRNERMRLDESGRNSDPVLQGR